MIIQPTALVEFQFDVFLSESHKWNDNVRMVVDEVVVEIGKTKE